MVSLWHASQEIGVAFHRMRPGVDIYTHHTKDDADRGPSVPALGMSAPETPSAAAPETPSTADRLETAANPALGGAARHAALAELRLAAASPTTIRQAAPHIVALLEGAELDVSRLAMGLAEDAGRACADVLPQLLPPLLARLRADESTPALLKRCLAVATSLFRPALAHVQAASESGDVEARTRALALLGVLHELREHADGLLRGTATDALRTAAAKLSEAVVLAFSEPSPVVADGGIAPPSAGSNWNLSALPPEAAVAAGGTEAEAAAVGDPLLLRTSLAAEGVRTLERMLEVVVAPPSATILLVVITSCVSLGKQRAALLPSIVRAVSELQQLLLARTLPLPPHQLANAQQSLRSSLLTLLKLPTVSGVAIGGGSGVPPMSGGGTDGRLPP